MGTGVETPLKVRAKVFDWVYRMLGTTSMGAPFHLPAPGIGVLRPANGLKRDLTLGLGPAIKRSRPNHATAAILPWEIGAGMLVRHEDEAALVVPPGLDVHGAQKAAKADDAKVPVHLWNERARKDSCMKPDDRELDRLRAWALQYWKHLITGVFARQCKWWREEAKGGKAVNLDAVQKGADALVFAAKSTWWDWPRGSAPFFWNWPSEYQELICNGLAPRFQ
jgi:hypothetical protein